LRVFSADFCSDQLVLALSERSAIAALSLDAGRPFSHRRDEADGLPRARPDLENLLASEADIVLRYWGGDPARFERVGIPTVTLAYAADFEAVKRNVRTAALALHQESRGEALIETIESRLKRLADRSTKGRRAFYVTPGGVTAGKGTMIDAIFQSAGLVNLAADEGLEGWPPLPAERLIASPPELIVAGYFDDAAAEDHWSPARHPAFRRIFSDVPTIHLSQDVLSCPGEGSLDAAEALADFLGKL
jgi:iron complex transport system substrate-binding protein